MTLINRDIYIDGTKTISEKYIFSEDGHFESDGISYGCAIMIGSEDSENNYIEVHDGVSNTPPVSGDNVYLTSDELNDFDISDEEAFKIITGADLYE